MSGAEDRDSAMDAWVAGSAASKPSDWVQADCQTCGAASSARCEQCTGVHTAAADLPPGHPSRAAAFFASRPMPPGYTAQELHDAKLRGIASSYFHDAQHWPAAMLCMEHLMMEQSKAAPVAPVGSLRDKVYPQAAPVAPAEPVAQPLTDEPDIIAICSEPDGSREWWSGGAWLRPGEAVAIIKHGIGEKAAPKSVQPLTDEQIQKIWDVASGAIPGWSRHITYARAIERAHGIGKEGGAA